MKKILFLATAASVAAMTFASAPASAQINVAIGVNPEPVVEGPPPPPYHHRFHDWDDYRHRRVHDAYFDHHR